MVHPDGAHPAGSAQPRKQPTKRNPHPNTGQPSDLAAVSGSALSMQLEVATLSPQWTHSFVFTEADGEWTEGALPWQQTVIVSLGASGKVVLHHALATSSGVCAVKTSSSCHSLRMAPAMAAWPTQKLFQKSKLN